MADIVKLALPAHVADVPQALRDMADRLEAEAAEYGAGFVVRVAVVMRTSGQEPRVYGLGAEASPPQVYMDLHAGAHQLMMMQRPER